MARKSGLYINATGKIFLASVAAWAGTKIYENFKGDAPPRGEEDDTTNRTYTNHLEDSPPQREWVLTKIPGATPEELEAERDAKIAANYKHVMEAAAAPEFVAWEAKQLATAAAREQRITDLKASGQWRWWMSENVQGWAILLAALWIAAAPIAWGISMVETHGDWSSSALHGAASFLYVAAKIWDGIQYLLA
jgi:hypothetical protein